MFIGGLEAEIQVIVWRNWKMSWSKLIFQLLQKKKKKKKHNIEFILRKVSTVFWMYMYNLFVTVCISG